MFRARYVTGRGEKGWHSPALRSYVTMYLIDSYGHTSHERLTDADRDWLVAKYGSDMGYYLADEHPSPTWQWPQPPEAA